VTSGGTAISVSQASPVLGGVETGSLDRGKAALERRNKKSAATAATGGGGGGGGGGGVVVVGGGVIVDDGCAKATTTGRVEVTRVNPDSLIDQLLKATNLDARSADEDSEHSKPPGAIGRDGRRALLRIRTGRTGKRQPV